MSDAGESAAIAPIKTLSKIQRRVLGTMVEKGITVPESYPLTLKALTTGCNQKNNREPVTNYSEDDVLEALDHLRAIGLAAVVHTESGRTERYRHYARKCWPELGEAQLAVLAELLLRGRQAAGDLRARASRMAPSGTLDSLEQLRVALQGLLERKMIQSDGSLDRRGVEVDHALYEPQEGRTMAPRAFDEEPPERPVPTVSAASPAAAMSTASPTASTELVHRVALLEATCGTLRAENVELRQAIDRLADDLRSLRESLGA